MAEKPTTSVKNTQVPAGHRTQTQRATPARVERVLIHGRTEDGKGLHVLAQRGDNVEAATVTPLEEGKPLAGDVVRLKPHKNFPLLCDVETEFSQSPRGANSDVFESSKAEPPQKGPAKVSTARYRKNWSAIFGASKGSKALN